MHAFNKVFDIVLSTVRQTTHLERDCIEEQSSTRGENIKCPKCLTVDHTSLCQFEPHY